jgi:hypothetical protein
MPAAAKARRPGRTNPRAASRSRRLPAIYRDEDRALAYTRKYISDLPSDEYGDRADRPRERMRVDSEDDEDRVRAEIYRESERERFYTMVDKAEAIVAHGEVTIYRALATVIHGDPLAAIDTNCIGNSWTDDRQIADRWLAYGCDPSECRPLVLVATAKATAIAWPDTLGLYIVHGDDESEIRLKSRVSIALHAIEKPGGEPLRVFDPPIKASTGPRRCSHSRPALFQP